MDQLTQFCHKQLIAIFGHDLRPLAVERLRQELEMIQSSGQLDAFEKARKAFWLLTGHGISCRLYGAGCSSFVSYLLGFSQIDPAEYGLPYERFLKTNPQGSIRFRFLADCPIGEPEEDFNALLKEVSCNVVHFRKSSSLSSIPSLVAEEIRQTRSDFSLASVPLNDEATFELLGSGSIEGIYCFEEYELQTALPDLRPRCLMDITAIIAIAMQEAYEKGALDKFIRQGLTQDDPNPEYRAVSEILDETRGMILFQEQIMLIMNRVADIPVADAYSFIKAAGTKRWETVETSRAWFVFLAIGNGIKESDALKLFEEIRDAATGAVCKSHHLSEALTIYRAAFLKTHFPREFFRTLQNIQQRDCDNRYAEESDQSFKNN